MKRTILSLLILVSISLATFATTNISDQKKGRRDYMKSMKLNDEQKEKMETINKEFAQKIDAVKKTRIAPDMQKERIQALRNEKQEAIADILTPEQKIQFEKRKVRGAEKGDRRQAHANMKGKRGFDGQPKIKERHGNRKIFENLNLTDAQKEQMKSLREKQITEYKEVAQKHKEEMKKILTPEQQKQFEENKPKFDKTNKGRKGIEKKEKSKE